MRTLHLKRAIALAVAAVLAVALGALAQDPTPAQDPALAQEPTGGDLKVGTVTRLDTAAKMISVKATNKEGVPAPGMDAKDVTIYWDQATKVEGTIREGELISFRAAQKDGKTVATFIRVGKVAPKPQGL